MPWPDFYAVFEFILSRWDRFSSGCPILGNGYRIEKNTSVVLCKPSFVRFLDNGESGNSLLFSWLARLLIFVLRFWRCLLQFKIPFLPIYSRSSSWFQR